MSHGRFNPNDPFLIGLEWPASLTTSDPIDPSRELAQVVRMASNATVARLDFHSPGPEPCGIECSFTNWILASIYERGQERNYGSVREASSAVSGGSTTGSFTGGALTVEDALSSPVDGRSISLDPGETIDIEFAAPFFLVLQPRILDVSFSVVAGPVTAIGEVGHAFDIGASIIDLGESRTPGIAVSSTHVLSTGEVFLGAYDYVATPTEQRRRGWQVDDITDLTTGTVRYRLRNNSVATAIQIAYVRMDVTYCQENRVGMGGIIRALDPDYPWVPGWQTGIEISDPASGLVGVPLLGGREYTVSLTQASNRRLTYAVDVSGPTAPINVQSGDSRDLSALSPTEGSPIECVAFQRFDDGRIAGPDVPVNRGYSMVLATPGGVGIGELSQPYVETVTIAGPGVAQDVVSTTGGTYAFVRVTVRKVGNPPDLVVQIGASTAILTAAEFDTHEQDPQGFATITVPLDVPVAMAAGVEQTVLMFTLGTNDHWETPILSVGVSNALYESVTYGGGNQAAVFLGLDVPVLLQMAAPTVTGLSVVTGTQTLSPAVTGCPQPQGMFVSLDYATICWGGVPLVTGAPPMASGAPIVSGFCAWDVERRDADDSAWRRIAHVTDYDVRCVQDFEARFGVSTDYRVRLCRIDGACGDWATATGWVRSVPDGCDGLVFTSNENPDATLAYPYAFEGTAVEEFAFVEAETVVTQRLHMRDYQVAFKPLERGGVRFSRTMLVNAASVPPRLLDEGFRSLRDLAWASLSYVAVLDTRGNRWFAAVIVPTGTVRSSVQAYLAAVEIIEVTDRPSVVDSEAV